jgi:1-deoxy-D-xylulose-5-phosphate synthase
MQPLLDQIKCPKDIHQIASGDLADLCKEIRELIVKVMSTNSGHLGASLGAVELAVGIHYAFNALEDSLVWDVGHQAYAHKILTGRKDQFDSIRQKGGLSGFPSRSESKYDDFGTGHSSTSISAVLGMAVAKKLSGDDTTSIAVIGDGSLTGGMAFEALNHMATEAVNAIVIINDNDMSIDPNVGGLQEHLNSINPDQNIFTNLGLNYHGTYEGNNMDEVLAVLQRPALKKGVHVLHFRTKKGFGYKYSEDGNPTHWHAPGKFEIQSGVDPKGKKEFPRKYQDIVGDALMRLMTEDEDVVVITPAMATGSSLKEVERTFPERFFDVAIAEQHAVTFSAGLAAQGKKPVCVIYSTFLQRGYDQLIHDVALQQLPVTFLIDRAGLVGNDGATHHGMFDLAYLNLVPNLTMYAPQDENQLAALIKQAGQSDRPVVIRYPRGRGILTAAVDQAYVHEDSKLTSEASCKGLVITIGAVGNKVMSSADYDVLALVRVKPIDFAWLRSVVAKYDRLMIIEDGVKSGGVAQCILAELSLGERMIPTELVTLPDEFIAHGSQDELYATLEMDQVGLNQQVQNFFALT